MAAIADVHRPTAVSIGECLREARLSEQRAESSILAQRTLAGESPELPVTEDLTDSTICQHFANAAELYGAAALDFVAKSNRASAYTYFRKAAANARNAAQWRGDGDSQLREKVSEYSEKAAAAWQEVARHNRRCLGLFKRRR